MRAAVLSEQGSTPKPADFAEPEAGEGSVVVDVALAGLNPIDLAIADGLVPARLPALPAVVGLEGIGRAEGGRRVYFDSPVAPHGTMAERVLVEESSLIDVPEPVEDGLAVSFGIAGLAAWLGLGWRGGLKEGETVLVLGSSGVVGQIAVQGAKLMGAGRVIAASRKAEDLEHSRAIGADETVQIDGDRLGDRFREAAGEGGVDLIIDPVWGDPAAAALEAIALRGRLVQIGNAAGASVELPTRAFRNQLGSILAHTNIHAPRDVKARAFAEMCEHGAAGELSVGFEVVSLEDVGDAWSRQAASPHHKLLIAPQ